MIEGRKCVLCGSTTTNITTDGKVQWYQSKVINKPGPACRKCFDRTRTRNYRKAKPFFIDKECNVCGLKTGDKRIEFGQEEMVKVIKIDSPSYNKYGMVTCTTYICERCYMIDALKSTLHIFENAIQIMKKYRQVK